MATEHPILMSGDMVRAYIAGRKTQTRRPLNSKRWNVNALNCCAVEFPGHPVFGYLRDNGPFGVPGDTLWFRETWFCEGRHLPGGMHYRANATAGDEMWFRENGWKWRPSIHMPRWAARFHGIPVLRVWAHKIRDITGAEAQAEGVLLARPHPIEFATLWESIYPGSWERNDWVWACEFRRAEG